MPHKTVTLASYKVTGATTCGFISAQGTQILALTSAVKVKYVSFVLNIRRGQSLSLSYQIRNSFAKFIRCWWSPASNIGTHWYRYGNMQITERSSFNSVVFGLSNIRAAPLVVCMCSEVTTWCSFITMSSVAVVIRSWSITGAAHLFYFLLNHAKLAGYMSHVFDDSFDGKHARLPRQSCHFDKRVLPIHPERLLAESLHRHVRAPDSRTYIPIPLFIHFLHWVSGERCSLIGV